MATEKPVLTYFDFAFWKTEPARLAFFIGNIDFVDDRVDDEQFNARKANSEFPFGQVPVLKMGGQKLTQGCAILRLAGKKAGLMPSDDFQVAKVDEVLHLLEEVQVHCSQIYRAPDEESKKKVGVEIGEKHLPAFYERLEKLLTSEKPKLYFAGDKLSVADLAVWKFIETFEASGAYEQVPAGAAKKFPTLYKFYQNIDSLPKIVAWKKAHPSTYK